MAKSAQTEYRDSDHSLIMIEAPKRKFSCSVLTLKASLAALSHIDK
jgi:hypothetical protein